MAGVVAAAGLGHRQHHPARVGELDGVAEQVEQDLANATGIGRNHLRHVARDMAAHADALGECLGGHQLDDIVGDLARRHGLRLGVETAGLDLRVVEQILDQREQRACRGGNRTDIGALLRRDLGVGEQLGHAHDAVHRRTDLVADRGEETRLCLACEFGALASADQSRLGELSRGDVARDRPVRNLVVRFVEHRQFDPGEPAYAGRGSYRHVGRTQAFAVGEGRVGHHADLDAKFGERLADKVASVRADQIGKHLVRVDDAAVPVAMHDEVAESVDQTAQALLAFLQLPHAVGKAFDLDAVSRFGFGHNGNRAVLRPKGARKHEEQGDPDRHECDRQEIRRAGQPRHARKRQDRHDRQEGKHARRAGGHFGRQWRNA